jgi:hypothetical protein
MLDRCSRFFRGRRGRSSVLIAPVRPFLPLRCSSLLLSGKIRTDRECGFDNAGKPVPKTFAVCTIRSTPSTAHHCIAWAKSYLLPQLFGADDEGQEEEELKGAEAGGENGAFPFFLRRREERKLTAREKQLPKSPTFALRPPSSASFEQRSPLTLREPRRGCSRRFAFLPSHSLTTKQS